MVERNDAHEHSAAQSRELHQARALLQRLLGWDVIMGGFEAPVWAEARAFLAGPRDARCAPALRPDELGD